MSWHWKSWPYWVRGGIIAVIFFIVLYILATTFNFYIPRVTTPVLLFPFLTTYSILEKILGCTVGHGLFVTPGLSSCDATTEFLVESVTWLLVATCYFVAGIGIGYLYGKWKSRKSPLAKEVDAF